jgi:hypothetical protein
MSSTASSPDRRLELVRTVAAPGATRFEYVRR